MGLDEQCIGCGNNDIEEIQDYNPLNLIAGVASGFVAAAALHHVYENTAITCAAIPMNIIGCYLSNLPFGHKSYYHCRQCTKEW